MKKLFSVLLAALLVVSMIPFVALADNSVTEIANYSQLVAWAKASASGNDYYNGKTAKLTADIVSDGSKWTPVQLKGTLDGQGHSITGLVVNATAARAGMFSHLYGTVKNIYIIDAAINASGKNIVGAIVGAGHAGALLENVYTNATVTGSQHTGGLVGAQTDTTGVITLKNCWFDGTIIAGGAFSGGLIGNLNNGNGTLIDCLYTGTHSTTDTTRAVGGFTSATAGNTGYTALIATRCVMAGTLSSGFTSTAGFLGQLSGTATFTDCFALEGGSDCAVSLAYKSTKSGAANSGNSIITFTETSPEDTVVISTDGANIEVPVDYELNSLVADQATLNTNAALLANGWKINDDGIIVPGYFVHSDVEISTYAELVEWAANGPFDANTTVTLTADITASGTWTPVAAFKGTFDGQGHSISGLTVSGTKSAFINDLYGTVKNLYILDSSFLAGTANYAGSVAVTGYDAYLENVYSNATITGANSCGGMIAHTGSGSVTMKSCWFDGSITISGNYASGMIGNQEMKPAVLVDCLNTAKLEITGTGYSIGAFSPATGNSTTASTLDATRCVNTGLIKTKANNNRPGFVGQICGTATFTDCYTIEGMQDHVARIVRVISGAANTTTLTTTVSGEAVSESVVATAQIVPLNFDAFNDVGAEAVVADQETLNTKSVLLNNGWEINDEGIIVPGYFVAADVEISNYAELADWGANGPFDENTTVVLTADINATGENWTPVVAFKGVFDGYSHTISNLTIEGETAVGFIWELFGTVKNVNFVDATVTATGNVCGTVAALTYNALIENVYSNATVTGGQSTGGLVGANSYPVGGVTLKSCWFDGEVISTTFYIGGLIGNLNRLDGTLIDCLCTGTVTTTANNVNVGGFTSTTGGNSEPANIYATRTVLTGAVVSGHASVQGGFIGNLPGNAVFTDCFALDGIYTGAVGCVRGTATLTSTITFNSTAMADSDVFETTGANGFNTEYKFDSLVADQATLNANATLLANGWDVNPAFGIIVPAHFVTFGVEAEVVEQLDVANYKGDRDQSEWIAPTMTGFAFAGWYEDADCTTVYVDTTGTAYAKFVSENIMNVHAQSTYTDGDQTADIRFLSTVDNLDYIAVGFDIDIEGKGSVHKILTSVYESVMAAGVQVQPEQLGTENSEYITFARVRGIPAANFDTEITAHAFWITPDGTLVNGAPFLTVCVNDFANS